MIALQIRHALPADAAAISKLISDVAHHFTLDPDGSGAEQFFLSMRPEAIEDHIRSENFIYLAAIADGRLAGVAAVRDRTHLYHLFVATEFQRRGIARALWQAVKSAAMTGGNDGGFTVNSTPYAVPVYERFGFRATGPRTEKNGIAFIPMRWAADEERG